MPSPLRAPARRPKTALPAARRLSPQTLADCAMSGPRPGRRRLDRTLGLLAALAASIAFWVTAIKMLADALG